MRSIAPLPAAHLHLRQAFRQFRMSVFASTHFIGAIKNNFGYEFKERFKSFCPASIETVEIPSIRCTKALHPLSKNTALTVRMRSARLSRFNPHPPRNNEHSTPTASEFWRGACPCEVDAVGCQDIRWVRHSARPEIPQETNRRQADSPLPPTALRTELALCFLTLIQTSPIAPLRVVRFPVHWD
jgi:hypothetical protein